VKNAHTKLIGQQPGDLSVLENQLHLNEVTLAAIKRFSSPQKDAMRKCCWSLARSRRRPKRFDSFQPPVDYWICTTYPRERAYRAWQLKAESRPVFA
jgi:hypothetical protein